MTKYHLLVLKNNECKDCLGIYTGSQGGKYLAITAMKNLIHKGYEREDLFVVPLSKATRDYIYPQYWAEYGVADRCSITREAAKDFYRDLCGTFGTSGNDTVVSYEMIAERMNLSVKRTMEFCRACFRYGITERQGGGVVI